MTSRVDTDRTTEPLLADLRAAIPAERVLRSGPAYDASVRQFNDAIRTRPAVVVRCAATADVQAAVRAARRSDVPLSVRGGGHDFWGRGLREGGVVVDLTGMREVRVDGAARVAEIGGGALSSDLVGAAEELDLTAVTGTAGSVGVLGLALGGGYGPLIGRHGTAADNLLGADVVLADGSRTVTDAEHEPDLLWALRGGGGNLGVVTSARLRLHPGATVVAGTVLYPLAQAGDVLRALDDALHPAPDELSVDVGFVTAPDGSPAVLVSPTWSGDPAVGLADDGPVHALARLSTPLMAEIGPVPRSVTLDAVDALYPFGRRGAIRTRTVAGWTDPLVDVLEESARSVTSPYSAILLHPFHGAATRVPVGDTAFAARAPHLMIEVVALWESDDLDDDRHLAWADRAHAALAPLSVPGGYVNVLGPEHVDQVDAAYGPNTERLLAVKAAYDPDSVFTATPLPGRAVR
ncbi:FAD-binding oxidoreductase [Pseudonocardia nematodicida]|uniref:FAD-binding oxidoreductase n=1 Tax=Pseudonocardia nematodicida TaxID=1206997 RepID=A0ABV1KG81_9PSEU